MSGTPPGADPSLAAGSALPVNESLLATAHEVIALFALEAEQRATAVHEFVQHRIDVLTTDQAPQSIGFAHGGTKAFIPPETTMTLSVLYQRPYHMDDPSAYELAFPRAASFYSQLIERGFTTERAYVNAAIWSANYAQAEYFGSVGGNEEARNVVSYDFVDDDAPEGDLSIADFKGAAANCQERAAVAHNTLLIMGVSSEFVAGNLEKEQPDGSRKSEPHAFLLVTNATGKKYIFDPTIPIIYWQSEGVIKEMSPAFYPYEPDANGQQDVQCKEYMPDGQMRRRALVYSFTTS